jgi:hypothetical protein
MLEPVDGLPVEISLRRDGLGVDIDLDGRDPCTVHRIVVDWPSTTLKSMTLIDTPGIGSLSDVGERTIELLAPDDDRGSAADAVLYLTPHLHSADVRFLEAFHDEASARATPVNAIGVLSRADEIGGGRADSLHSAARVAARYRDDNEMRRLCQTLVPVAGLLAQGAATLTEREFRAFVALAALDESDADWLVASADRFALTELPALDVAPEERARLLDRFGVFGVRLACDLIRHTGIDTARTLADELRCRSGLDELRTVLADNFAARRDVLKARSALLGLTDVTKRWPLDGDAGAAVRADIERLTAGAHELDQLRALLAVRRGDVPLDEASTIEAEHLLSGSGTSSIPVDVDAIVDAVARWRGKAEHPLAPPSVIELSQIVVRTLETTLAESESPASR